jgi:copper chaperone
MQTKLNVEGMTCSHCENAVRKAVSAIDGVTGVTVDLAGKVVTVTHSENVTADIIKNEIEEQGYDVI